MVFLHEQILAIGLCYGVLNDVVNCTCTVLQASMTERERVVKYLHKVPKYFLPLF